ncbi:MAG: M48 family metallopeptidase [Pirellulales bacterium]
MKSSSSGGESNLPPARDPRFRQRLLAELEAPIRPVRRSLFYRLALVLVTLVVLVLPLVYLAFIGLVGYGVYWHVVNDQWLLTAVRGPRGRLLMVIVYVAPLVVGVIAIFFMFKPLLARPAKKDRTRSLTEDGEPLLFEFVEQICELVHAPAPSRIDVNSDVNASAGFRRGVLSMLGNDLVLTIGAPLIAGLSLQQFAGVVAHEFGHFSQGLGMRMTYIIRSINLWLARVVYERDEWDEALAHYTGELDVRLSWVLMLAQGCVVISRGLLWVLMMFGAAVSGVMLRQMEYDADRYTARLIGRKGAAETLSRIPALDLSHDIALRKLLDLFHDQKLADNLPELTLRVANSMPAEVRHKIHSAVSESSSGWFDTHPSLRERLNNLSQEEDEGVFNIDARAVDLFRHFEPLSRNVTWDFYCTALGGNVRREFLLPLDEVLATPSGSASRSDIPETIKLDD